MKIIKSTTPLIVASLGLLLTVGCASDRSQRRHKESSYKKECSKKDSKTCNAKKKACSSDCEKPCCKKQ